MNGKDPKKVLTIMKGSRKHYKTEQILRHMLTHKRGITSWTAWEKYHTTRLAVIISNLRHIWGIDITTITESDDKGNLYARYILEPWEEEESA